MPKPEWLAKREEEARQGDYESLELGGHRCYIVEVQPFYTSKSQLKAWRILYDTCPDDRQPFYFRRQYENDKRPDPKWRGTLHSWIVDDKATFTTKEGKPSFYGQANFAKFTTSIEDSNPGFFIDYTEDYMTEAFCLQFKNKEIGIVFGKEFYADPADGSERMSIKPRYFRRIDGVEEADIPKDKRPKQEEKPKVNENGFMHLADDLEDEGLPFNV